ncbi:putative phenylalanine--tRNA ligase beta subunit [Platanthera zijinensis]|uniref:phenylalanine--tRNA ligase n=1 Tax=Platanthera zijinensis TaxID=2320716 RepID=A0AAP0BUH6_9ASPA
MPTVSVGRDRLFQALGRSYTQEEFEELCFEYGIELDDVTTEKEVIRKEKHLEATTVAGDSEEVIYKIEVAANRYDLLCLEGIARALRIFIGKEKIPVYSRREIPCESILQINVSKETSQIRPYVVCAILKGVSFNGANYNSFIDLQDKLHQNICRKRTLVAIGTHDLDKVEGPFSYESQALKPQDITFVPLKQEKSFRADELLEFYRSDLKLKKFLPIIENSSVYPVIYDKNRTVLSLPPIINGAQSAISLRTKNVLIECTATDLTKAKIVLNTMVTMFSEYCDSKFEVEPVGVVYPDDRQFEDCAPEGAFKGKNIYPDLAVTVMDIPLAEITSPIGVSLGVAEVIRLLEKMQLHASLNAANSVVTVYVPPTRSDILHPCDVMEDVAIAYGYNKIPKTKPKCMTTGGQQPLNVFSDKIRGEVSRAGYMEVLTWLLCSHEENFAMVKRKDDGVTAVIIGNPRTSEFEVVRTSLMSGLLKTLKHNIDHRRPIKIFEAGDIVLLDGTRDVGALNNRRLAALCCNVTSGFEEILGLATRIMQVVRKPHEPANADFIRPSNVRFKEPEFFPNRQCYIVYNGKQIGCFGIVHPEVLEKFGIPDPCSFVEIDVEALL